MLFREDPGSTFSDIWYRAGPMRPRLSPHAQIIRQEFGPDTAFVVEDPASGQFYRLTPSAYFFVGLLDGLATVDEAWAACNAQLGDSAPTQRECIELLSRLQLYGLLLGDVPLAADMVLERKRAVRATRVARRTGKFMFFTIPLVNPEPFLERYKHIIGAIYSRWGLAVWAALVLAALWAVATHAQEFGARLNFAELLGTRNLLWISAAFLFLRVVHELGHASACKAIGGRSTEIGVILIAGLIPLPYCDATSSWRAPEVWKRVLVAAAGVLVETFFAAIAALVWAYSEPGLLKSVCYNVMLVSGVTTLVFNLNPLLRYDGYYILSDLTGTPNLAQRSRELLRFLLERHAFGLRGLRPPAVRDRGELALLLVYGILSAPYRIFIAVSILLMLSEKWVTLGAVLAVVLGVAWLIWPLAKAAGYLAGEPKLMGRRARAVGVASGALAVVLVVLGVVPMPAAGYATGTLDPEVISALRAGESGFIRRVLAQPGEPVEAGAPVFILENPQIESEAAVARAQLERLTAELDGTADRSLTERALAEARLDHQRVAVQRIEDRLAALTVRAAASGRLVAKGESGMNLGNLVGRFVQRGDLLATVQSTDRLRVRATVSDSEHAYIFRHGGEWPRPAVRLKGMAGERLPARIVRHAPAGLREVNNPADSAQSGGEVVLDPSDPEGKRTLQSQFLVEVEPERLPAGARAGLRARIRFGVPAEPLLSQWTRRVRQYFTSRIGR